MRELRYLSLPSMGDKTKLELGNLVNLETLEHFSTTNSSVRDLDRMTKLRKPSISIQSKAIETLSSSLSKLRRLENLRISACWLVENPIPILEKLVQLKSLRLWHQSLSGRRMVCSSGGFPQLQELLIQGLDEWEEWIVEEGFMPLLHTLEISDCKKLKKLPDGLSLIYSLKDLRMDKEWKERLSEGGEDYYKVQHIPSVEFY